MIAPQTVLSDHTVLAEPPPSPDPRGPDGVLSISADRWATAQRYEAHCWLERYRTATDDREREHAERFDGYRLLSRHYGRAIELGCGPFTQSRRIIRGGVEVDELTLVDPLLDRYEELPNCSYSRLARGRRLIRYASALEELALPARGYDLVISINVLEHCRDYVACLDAIRSLAAKGATIVISEPSIARADLDESLRQTWDAGHPIRVADDRLHRDIESLGRPLYGRMFPGLYGAPWRRDYYYILEAK
jgi:hypothetical protein